LHNQTGRPTFNDAWFTMAVRMEVKTYESKAVLLKVRTGDEKKTK
jgi:hypothetical protein